MTGTGEISGYQYFRQLNAIIPQKNTDSVYEG